MEQGGVVQRGSGVTEFLLLVMLIAIVCIGLFNTYGRAVQQNVAGLALELTGGEQVKSCELSPEEAAALDLVFDQRVNRYRHKRTGRFVKFKNC